MPTTQQVQYGSQTIEYTLSFAPRKTLAINVHPDLSVNVKAPENSDIRAIQQKVSKRAAWILKQQRQFAIYLPDVPPRQYVSGESHRYLGRQYRLKIQAAHADGIQLTRQFLIVESCIIATSHVRELVQTWYQKQAAQVFGERLQDCYARLKRLDIPAPRLSIRKMSGSWGTCSARGTISLNVKLIQVPREFIDYVIVHELCHLKHLHHGPEFYKLLARAMPDWESKRNSLNRFDFG